MGPYTNADQDCLILSLSDAGRQLAEVSARLSQEEQKSTRALFMKGDAQPGFEDFPRVTSLEELAALSESGWLVELLRQDRLTSHFHPIVRARQPEQVVAHEALMRGVDAGGEVISPARILGAARSTGLLFQVDRAARLSAIRQALSCNLDSMIFINFTPTAIYDPVNCLASTVKLIHDTNLSPHRVVFEVVESEQVEDQGQLASILRFYREAGFRVALDDLGSGYGSLNRMSELRPDYVKLDVQLIRGVDQDPFKATIADRLLSMARDLGVETVVEGVETLQELRWAQDHGADLVQGYLLARPANPPQKPRWPQPG